MKCLVGLYVLLLMCHFDLRVLLQIRALEGDTARFPCLATLFVSSLILIIIRCIYVSVFF